MYQRLKFAEISGKNGNYAKKNENFANHAEILKTNAKCEKVAHIH